MSTLPSVSLATVHAAILAAQAAHFGDRVATYGAYRPWDALDDAPAAALATPALLLELESVEFDGESDPEGRLAAACTWVLHCVLGGATDNLQAALPQFAASAASVVLPYDAGRRRGNLWGLAAAADPPQAVSAQPGVFVPGLGGRDAWALRWDQTFYVSEVLP